MGRIYSKVQQGENEGKGGIGKLEQCERSQMKEGVKNNVGEIIVYHNGEDERMRVALELEE